MIDELWRARIDDALASVDNKFITRVPNAGTLVDNYQIMHNGLKVVTDGYCGSMMTELIKENKGVHEPQEERIFQQILPLIRPNAIMVELGCYWSFYSLWFQTAVKNGKSYMIDESEEYLNIGKRNFELNNQKGTFHIGSINRDITLKRIMDIFNLHYIDLLHADIQHAEVEMIRKDSDILNMVDYLFLSTHSEEGHKICYDIIKNHMKIIANIEINKSHSVDGLIVAQCKSLNEIKVEYTLR